jgi:hypothetical protein
VRASARLVIGSGKLHFFISCRDFEVLLRERERTGKRNAAMAETAAALNLELGMAEREVYGRSGLSSDVLTGRLMQVTPHLSHRRRLRGVRVPLRTTRRGNSMARRPPQDFSMVSTDSRTRFECLLAFFILVNIQHTTYIPHTRIHTG